MATEIMSEIDPTSGSQASSTAASTPQVADQALRGRQPPRLSEQNSYSFFVACMKLLLPAIAAGLVILVVIWPQIRGIDQSLRIPSKDVLLEQAQSLSMMNARFDGLDEKNQPYSLTADVATQQPGEDQLIDFQFPKGDIMLSEGAWLAVVAKTGRYARDTEMLELNGDVKLFHDQGYELHTEFAIVDLNAGTAEGDQPVEGQGPGGFLASEGFRIMDQGRRIFFTGQANMILFTDSEEAIQ